MGDNEPELGLGLSPQAIFTWATVGILGLQFHLLGSAFVITRTFLRWYRTGFLSLALRLPFYIATFDLVLYCFYVQQAASVLKTGQANSDPATCKAIGLMIFYFMGCNMTLVLTVAITTYLRVSRLIYFELGSYDWKLLSIVFLFPIPITCVGIPSFGMDVTGFMCFISDRHQYTIIFTIILFLGTSITCIFCYVAVFRTIVMARAELTDITIPEYERRIVKKVISYVLMFALNWGPTIPYMVGVLVHFVPFSFYLLESIGVVLGGILNGIQYAINEGVWSREDTMTDSDTRLVTAPPPRRKPEDSDV